MKLIPPCLKVRYGNFQIFPRPIEHPIVETTKAGLLYHLSLVVTISPGGAIVADYVFGFAASAVVAAGATGAASLAAAFYSSVILLLIINKIKIIRILNNILRF